MSNWKIFAALMLVTAVATGCASGSAKEMSAKDEARYLAAIERADTDTSVHEAEYVVSVSPEAVVEDDTVTAAPVAARSFAVSRQDYDDFFAQSPGVILGRMTLDPITDGGSLLGYRVLDLKSFPGIDLVNEDIIVGLNGKLPQNPDQYFSAWESAKSASECIVNVQRGTERFDLNWHVE